MILTRHRNNPRFKMNTHLALSFVVDKMLLSFKDSNI